MMITRSRVLVITGRFEAGLDDSMGASCVGLRYALVACGSVLQELKLEVACWLLIDALIQDLTPRGVLCYRALGHCILGAYDSFFNSQNNNDNNL